LFEDTAALSGLLIAAAGIAAAHTLNAPRLDGVASIGIALVLLVSSLLLVRETKALLVGEAAHPHLRDAILRIAADDPGVHHANGVLAVQLGPNQVVAALSLQFREALSTKDIESCVTRIESSICRDFPEVVTLLVKPQSTEIWLRRSKRRVSIRDDHPDE
jgi:divalent metal cation (Fe/Co/Zn/Cd) transporter